MSRLPSEGVFDGSCLPFPLKNISCWQRLGHIASLQDVFFKSSFGFD